MRRLLIASAAIATIAGAAFLAAPRAEAMTLPGAVAAPKAAEDVRLVCKKVWNGYRWVRECVEVYGGGGGYGYGGGGGDYYAPPRTYYAPRPYYGGGGYGYGGGGYSY